MKKESATQSRRCDTTQSSQTPLLPVAATPEASQIPLDETQSINKSVRSHTGTKEIMDDKNIQQSPNQALSSEDSTHADETQLPTMYDPSHCFVNIHPIKPLQLPGRKLIKPIKQSSKKRHVKRQSKTHRFGIFSKKEVRQEALAVIPAADDDEKPHDKKCIEEKRKYYRSTEILGMRRLRTNDFMKCLDDFRDNPIIISCFCEPESCPSLKHAGSWISNIGHRIGEACSKGCCPPMPRKIFAKCAFWPPKRGYYFVKYNENLPWSAALNENHKIVKPNKTIALEEKYSFGVEHSCCDRVDNITPFVIQNTHKQFIAGVLARPRFISTNLWVIYSHPNGSDLSDVMTIMPSPVHIADYLCANVVAYDYPGYGLSTGKANEENFYGTMDSIINYIHKTYRIPFEHMVLWGYSIGTVCSVHAAMNFPVAGVLLFAPVASIMRGIKNYIYHDPTKFNPKTSSFDSFSTLDMISRVQSPILICHGEKDRLIPITHGQALLAQAQKTNSKVYGYWDNDVTHNNTPNSSKLWERVKQFIRKEINNVENLQPIRDETDAPKKKSSRKNRKSSKKRKQHRKSKPNEKTPLMAPEMKNNGKCQTAKALPESNRKLKSNVQSPMLNNKAKSMAK